MMPTMVAALFSCTSHEILLRKIVSSKCSIGMASFRTHEAKLMTSASAVHRAVLPCFLAPQPRGNQRPSPPFSSSQKPLVDFVV